MDNSKKNVHNSGPLGMLVKTGQIKKVDLDEEPSSGTLQHIGLDALKTSGTYFKTQSGIQFAENELVFVDPKECEPWEYANRSADEMGEMDDLIQSIKDHTQLQPALVRQHPAPHDGIKYQIIFGRRRHVACLQLGVPFLVIRKNTLTITAAIACQHAENKFRKNVSNYSNALLYKKLMDDAAFKTEKELAKNLNISTSTLNDLLSYAKIPAAVIKNIPDIHTLPVYMALKIVRLLAENNQLLEPIIQISPAIGKTINTPAKLEMVLKLKINTHHDVLCETKTIQDRQGKRVFIFKIDHKGTPSIIFQKELLNRVDFDSLCDHLRHYIDSNIKSGRPDLAS